MLNPGFDPYPINRVHFRTKTFKRLKLEGLLAQGMEPFDGAALGVYIHGLAGDLYRERCGAYGMVARELADEIGRVVKL